MSDTLIPPVEPTYAEEEATIPIADTDIEQCEEIFDSIEAFRHLTGLLRHDGSFFYDGTYYNAGGNL